VTKALLESIKITDKDMDLFAYEFAPQSQDFLHLDRDDTLEIVTCQRSVVLSHTELADARPLRAFEGASAYDYLLRFACGLESQIKGETDVFGQVKSAYKELSSTRPEVAATFQTLFLKLLEDTKDLRANYLHGIGGNTYGALARRLLSPNSNDRVLIIGAGQISKSIAPYFAESKLTVFNRSLERLK
jgi:glutamyl-tRNA reductase